MAVTIFGCDIARTGADKTVIAIRQDQAIVKIIRWAKLDTMETVGRIVTLTRRYHPQYIIVDVIGIGAGVVDRLREMNYPVIPFNASERATGTDRSGELEFLNKRAEAWWNMREILDPNYGYEIQLPNDDLLIRDLISPRWKTTSAGRIVIESKEDIAKRLQGKKDDADVGRSTDCGDAVVMAFYEGDRSAFEESYGLLTPSGLEEVKRQMNPQPEPTEAEGMEKFLWGKAEEEGIIYTDI